LNAERVSEESDDIYLIISVVLLKRINSSKRGDWKI